MLHSADNSASLIRRANWIYRLEETNPDNLIKGWLVLYENGLLEFKDDLNQPTSCRQIFLGNANVKVLAGYACQELLVSNQKLENAFVIVDAEKNHFFKCDTSEELRLWVNDLRNVIQRKKAEVKIYAPYGQPPVYVYGTLYEVPHHNEYTNHISSRYTRYGGRFKRDVADGSSKLMLFAQQRTKYRHAAHNFRTARSVRMILIFLLVFLAFVGLKKFDTTVSVGHKSISVILLSAVRK
ncbi:hypothetical protein T01_3536 [Trichinella spiralis]|uniref:PH domain-containing protein n=1 Tax=Trichinella spiralis TaxID=6334 RepID=A0A0V1B544_TRISP|nr:hypothetical protein T01_3536 [Trichinella spiralis]